MIPPRRPPTVMLLGYYGSGNLGDEAILGTTLAELRRRVPDIRAIVPGDDPNRLTCEYDVISHSWQDLERLIESIGEADVVVVGGGGLLHDYWPPHPENILTPAHFGLTYYCGMGWLAAELGKPVFLYAAGVGPLLHWESRDLVRALARATSGITVRDLASRQLLEELGVPGNRVEVTADPAWLVEPADVQEVEGVLHEAAVDCGEWMVVALRNWDVGVSQEAWEAQVVASLGELAHRHNLGVVFLPFQHMRTQLQDDLGLAESLAAKLQGARSFVVRRPLSASLAMGLVQRASLLVGMRFHAVLFGAATGTPTVALAYDPKVKHLAEESGEAAEVLDLAGLRADSVIAAADAVLSQADRLRREGPQRAAVQKARALVNVERLAEILGEPPLLVASEKAQRIAADVIDGERLARASGTSTLFVAKTFSEEDSGATEDDLWPTIEVGQERLVRLVTSSFFDPTGTTMYSGGGERYAVELAALVKSRGWNAEIVQPGEGAGWEREYRGVKVLGLGGITDRFSLGGEVERRLPAVPVTLYHAFYLAAAAECRTLALGVSHGIFWDDPAWAGDPILHHRLKEKALESVRRLDLVVSVDANTINWVRAEEPALAEKMIRVPNFVDLKQFRNLPKEAGARSVILFPRRLCRARGYWLLESILPGLLERHPDLELHLVGNADAVEAHHAQSLVERFRPRVRWYVLPMEGMVEAYRQADIVLIPTVAAEGTSLSLLEAQACGRPVIATAVGGLADLVIDGHNALVIQPTPAALESAIERLLDDPELARGLAERGLSTARYFSKERWQRQWLELLRSFLTPPGSGSTSCGRWPGFGRNGVGQEEPL